MSLQEDGGGEAESKALDYFSTDFKKISRKKKICCDTCLEKGQNL